MDENSKDSNFEKMNTDANTNTSAGKDSGVNSDTDMNRDTNMNRDTGINRDTNMNTTAGMDMIKNKEKPKGPNGPGPYRPYQRYPGAPAKKSHTGLFIFLGIVGIFIVFIFLVGRDKGSVYSVYTREGSGENIVDLVTINGEIVQAAGGFMDEPSYDHKFTKYILDSLIEDAESSALLIYVNTPGGGIYETDELYERILQYQDTGRSVFVYMGPMAASGGYYLSAPADKIYANRNTWTGSIGVTMGTLIDFTDLMAKYGIKTKTLTAGRNKAMGSMFDPLTEEQLAILQGMLDEAYAQFVEVVATGRDLPLEKVTELADGRIYTAKQAMENGLIDEIATFDEVTEEIASVLYNDAKIREHVNNRKRNFLSQLLSLTYARRNQTEAGTLLEFADKMASRIGYYSSFPIQK